MKIMILLLLSLSFSALAAEKTVLICSTNGDSLDYLKLIESNGKSIAKIKIGMMDEEEDPGKIYNLTASLKNIKAGDADTLVGQLEGSEEFNFGGAISNAVLIRILPGQKKGYLSAENSVFYLNCNKP